LMMFLVCSCLFYFCKLQRDDGRRGINVLIAGVLLAYLALTKVFFGYVIMCALLLALVVFLLRRERKDANSLLVCALSFVLCVPWLAYTHSVTGKFLCWGTSGGSALYWMSSSFAGEWGDWRAKQDLEVYPQLALNHGAFVNSLEGLNQVQMDEAFKKKSIENIRQHPTKYLRNCLANIGRLLFNYPYSYAPQTLSSYGYLIPNMFNVVLWVLCLYPSVAGWRRYPYEMIAALVFGAIALFGSSLFSAYLRMGWPVLPLAGLWVAFSLNRVLRIEMRRTDEAAALEP
jgi:4-amino-4-deoxy-L-arabinose transferase-like glycosyltransferase